jgi:hypothetical protein
MFWNTSQKEHPVHILNLVILLLYGITNMQVLFFVSTFLSKFSEDLHFFALPLCFYSHLLIIVDVEFGRLQARDMLQHLWTGPILNASIDVVQGGRSVEVRAVGVKKVTDCFL